jgi:Undecaprenyl-phosphate glucose phosphotransferase
VLKHHSQFFKSLMVILDGLFLSLAWWIAYFVRFQSGVLLAPGPHVFRHYVAAWFLLLISWGSVFAYLELYQPRRISSHWREVADIFKGSCLALLVFFAFVFLIRDVILSRLVVVSFFVLNLAFLNLSHVGFREGLRALRRRGYNLRHVVIVGFPAQAKQLIDKLRWYRHLGIHIVAIYLISDDNHRDKTTWGETVLENPADLLKLVRESEIDQLFITLPLQEAPKLKEIRSWLGDEPVTIYFVPDLTDLKILGGKMEEFDGLPIISIQDSRLYGWNLISKRVVDIAVGIVALLLFLPLMALIALGIKLTSPGPIFYRQERMGLDGKRFQMLKFRTMVEDAETSTGPVWAADGDSRITPLGRWLRKTSLDELPQLVNVWKGEMSLVGPRPERPPLIAEFRKSIPEYMLRHKVKAGMTGWAQVNGLRGNTSLEQRIEHDIEYIENWSLYQDFKILALTLWRGFLNKSAG